MELEEMSCPSPYKTTLPKVFLSQLLYNNLRSFVFVFNIEIKLAPKNLSDDIRSIILLWRNEKHHTHRPTKAFYAPTSFIFSSKR